MEKRYNVYFAGQLLAGHDLARVRSTLGKLFNADETTLDKLFSGQNQLVKRDCDEETALKYRQAMEQAGARPVITAITSEVTKSADTPPAQPKTKTMTAAERIAALAATPDLAAVAAGDTAVAPPPSRPESDDEGIELAPAGTSVLLPEERKTPAISTVNELDLELATSGQRLSDSPPSPPPAPDTSHLSADAMGELLPNLPSAMTPVSPDITGIELSPQDYDLSDCAAPSPAPPELDLSNIVLAPAGADVLEPQYRKRDDTTAPATDHLTLED